MVYEGLVKWFASRSQPWGFIQFVDETGAAREIFSHFRNILPDNQENPRFKVLKAGQKVQFEIGEGYPASRGTQALKIKVLL